MLKLRGEVGRLRRQVAEARIAPAKPTAAEAAADQPTTTAEQLKEVGIARMTYTKAWVLAFVQYAQNNQGQFPTNFSQALPYWPTDLRFSTAKGEVALQPDESTTGPTPFALAPDKYDIAYQGSLNSLANPQSIIVLREKDAWQTTDGGWVRTYAFADGHSEVHKAIDGNFLPWEQQHMASAATPGGTGQ